MNFSGCLISLIQLYAIISLGICTNNVGHLI